MQKDFDRMIDKLKFKILFTLPIQSESKWWHTLHYIKHDCFLDVMMSFLWDEVCYFLSVLCIHDLINF